MSPIQKLLPKGQMQVIEIMRFGPDSRVTWEMSWALKKHEKKNSVTCSIIGLSLSHMNTEELKTGTLLKLDNVLKNK